MNYVQRAQLQYMRETVESGIRLALKTGQRQTRVSLHSDVDSALLTAFTRVMCKQGYSVEAEFIDKDNSIDLTVGWE